VRALKIRTSRGMVALTPEEAVELRQRLRLIPAARPASQTIAVSANASTSVTLTEREKAAVLDVLANWSNDASRNGTSGGMTAGLRELESALASDLGLNQQSS
jgi:hypothetical protein